MTMQIEITVQPMGCSGRYSASIDGRVIIANSRTPFLAAARALLAEDVTPDSTITMRHHGSDITSLRSTVGHAAKLTVRENETTGPRFEPLSQEGHFLHRRIDRPCVEIVAG